MTALYILAAVFLLLVLLAQLPIGCQVEYGAEGLRAWARLGPVRIQLLPWTLGHKKQKTESAAPNQKSKSAPEPVPSSASKPALGQRLGGALEYAQELVPLAVEAAGQFYRKLRMDILELELTVGSPDPADAAMTYGRANAALAALWEPLIQAFHVKDGSARVTVDFSGGGTRFYGKAALSLRVGQALRLGLVYGFKALRTFLKVREEHATEKQQRKAA